MKSRLPAIEAEEKRKRAWYRKRNSELRRALKCVDSAATFTGAANPLDSDRFKLEGMAAQIRAMLFMDKTKPQACIDFDEISGGRL